MVINFRDDSQESKPSPRNNLQPNFYRKIHLSEAIYSSAKHHQKNTLSQTEELKITLSHENFIGWCIEKNRVVNVVNFRCCVKVFKFWRLTTGATLNEPSLQFLRKFTPFRFGHAVLWVSLWNTWALLKQNLQHIHDLYQRILNG